METVKTVFDLIFKHISVHLKYSAVCFILNSLLNVWKCGETWSFVLIDIILLNPSSKQKFECQQTS